MEQHAARLEINACGVVVGKRLLDVTRAVEYLYEPIATALGRDAGVVLDDVAQATELGDAVAGREIEALHHLAGHATDVGVGIGDEAMVNVRATALGCFVDEDYLIEMPVP